MGSVVAMNHGAFTASQILTIRNTVAAGTTPDEFNLFMEVAARTGLDPFRKQVFPLIFNARNADKRRMSIVVGRDGARVLATRSRLPDGSPSYRPSDQEPEITYDETLKGPCNPLGIVKAVVRVYQRDVSGEWHPVVGVAYWDEYAPVAEEWKEDETGKRRPTGKKALDTSGQWPRQPRNMITKCAEMAALRSGWPETWSGIYAEEELDRARAIDMAESNGAWADAAESAETQARLKAIGRVEEQAIVMQFHPTAALEFVPVGKVFDAAMNYIEGCTSPDEITAFAERNRASLKEYWAHAKSDALELKRQMEAKAQAMAAP